MSMIKIEHLTFSYPGSYDNVFEDAGFQIDSGWRLGLVGRNGRGKTTLFRLLRGEYAYSGKITSTVEFAGFPYPVRDPEALTREVLEEICPEAEDWRLLRELSLLEVEEGALWRPFRCPELCVGRHCTLPGDFLRLQDFFQLHEVSWPAGSLYCGS